MTRRVAVAGYAHEVNARADVVTLAAGWDAATEPGGLAATWEAGALVRRLQAHGCEVVELPCWELGAGGPLYGGDFRRILGEVAAGLDAAGDLDAVVVLGHGAGRTTDDLDPDATFLEAVRRRVGPGTPVVVVLDFHANLSARMCGAADVLVGYRTNPHVDVQDRLVEAADQVARLLGGGATALAHCRLPLLLPQVAQNTTGDEPLAAVMAQVSALTVPPVRNISVFGGFPLADVPEAGVSVCVTVDAGAEGLATVVAEELARMVWKRRSAFRVTTTPLDEAARIALAAASGDRPPALLADLADNPGGGAPGNSPFVLEALRAAGVTDVVMGLHCDPSAVAAAWEAGIGARCQLRLNAGSTRPLAPPVDLDATVVALTDDRPLVPTRGVYAGARRHPGRCAAVEVGGIRLALSSRPVQCADDDTLRHAGLDPSSARVVVVKSRGHFRAGFDHLFAPEQIVEVGAPGVATNDLESVDWQHVKRPVLPLDAVDGWRPVATVHGAPVAP